MTLLNRLREHYFQESISQDEEPDLELEVRAAAVLIPVTDNETVPELILTRRAEHLATHAGQISFPGGMWEPEDENLSYTALRESWEEIGLQPSKVELVAKFPARESRFGVQVTPFLGVIPSGTELVPCEDETDQILSVPLSFFMEQEPTRIDYKERGGRSLKMPSWNFQDQEIWGLTAMIIDEMLHPLREIN